VADAIRVARILTDEIEEDMGDSGNEKALRDSAGLACRFLQPLLNVKLLYGEGDEHRKGVLAMARTAPFYSINEIGKAIQNRVFHDNDLCAPGYEIPINDRRLGTNNYRECEVCQRRNKNWDSLPHGAARDLTG
jgi:hypothetical protein